MDHETGEALEGTRNADGGRDLDENALCGVNENLKLAGLVDRGVQERQKALDQDCD